MPAVAGLCCDQPLRAASSMRLATEGTPCAGKTALSTSLALQLVTSSQWAAVHWVDLSGCTNYRAAMFAFLAACGIPSDIPEAATLLAWLARVCTR